MWLQIHLDGHINNAPWIQQGEGAGVNAAKFLGLVSVGESFDWYMKGTSQEMWILIHEDDHKHNAPWIPLKLAGWRSSSWCWQCSHMLLWFGNSRWVHTRMEDHARCESKCTKKQNGKRQGGGTDIDSDLLLSLVSQCQIKRHVPPNQLGWAQHNAPFKPLQEAWQECWSRHWHMKLKVQQNEVYMGPSWLCSYICTFLQQETKMILMTAVNHETSFTIWFNSIQHKVPSSKFWFGFDWIGSVCKAISSFHLTLTAVAFVNCWAVWEWE